MHDKNIDRISIYLASASDKLIQLFTREMTLLLCVCSDRVATCHPPTIFLPLDGVRAFTREKKTFSLSTA